MRRRSILSLFGAAPVAAIMPPDQSSFSVKGGNVGSAAGLQNGFDEYHLADPVRRAYMNRDAIRRLHRDGLMSDNSIGQFESANIDSLKATSRVRKIQLQEEWRIRRRLMYAEAGVERAIKEALLPDWMRRFI